MARVYLIENNPRSELFYSVDAAVGSGRANHYDDVLLVQFLLKVRSECGVGHEEYVPPGTGPIAIDGICGSQTVKYIQRFQQIGTLRNPTIPLTQDGVVSPVLAGSGSLDGARTNRFLTIAALNSVYGKIRGKAASRDITHDALFPRELTPYLKVSA
jgi:peptidoglycan hydrolase-like protein with peptidoglycan-binding domain